MKQTILHEGDEILRKPSADWDLDDPELLTHVQDLLDSLVSPTGGLGLASPQIGVSRRSMLLSIPARAYGAARPTNTPTRGSRAVFGASQSRRPTEPAIDPFAQPKDFFGILINPRVISHSKETCVFDEGCLSLPGLHARVKRPQRVTISAELIDCTGWEVGDRRSISYELRGMTARVFQHEFDHLEGVLFIDRLEGFDKTTARMQWEKLKKL